VSAAVRIEDVTFRSEDVRCAGTLFRPREGISPGPGLVMGNGFANVRGMYLPDYAARFAEAGITVLTIDYRFLGDSGGQPRQQVIPEDQCADLRNALTWLTEHPDVDASRVALWGTSFGGGHVLRVAAMDRRVAAVVAQVPAIGLWRYLRRMDAGGREEFLAGALRDRLAFAETGRARELPITAEAGAESLLGSAGLGWHRRNETEHQSFHNWIAAHSLDRIVPYDPGAFVEDISPTPLMVIVTDPDTTTPSDVAREVYARAGHPKRLVELDGGHYDVYDTAVTRARCIDATVAFLGEHLVNRPDPDERTSAPPSTGAAERSALTHP
jgi:uncharacterized protein